MIAPARTPGSRLDGPITEVSLDAPSKGGHDCWDVEARPAVSVLEPSRVAVLITSAVLVVGAAISAGIYFGLNVSKPGRVVCG